MDNAEQSIEFSFDIRYFDLHNIDELHELDGLELCWQSYSYLVNQLKVICMTGKIKLSKLWNVHLNHIGGW
jgi:hypothetical protein